MSSQNCAKCGKPFSKIQPSRFAYCKKCSIVHDVLTELLSAQEQHQPMNSFHEGYAVLLEEVEELWDEIKTKNKSIKNIHNEAIQVAAVAIRIIHDLIEKESE